MFSTASPIPSRNGINNSCSLKDGVFSFHRNIATPTIFPRRKMGKEASQESSQKATSAAREPPCSRNRSMGNRAENRASARRYSSGRTGSEPTPPSVPPSGCIQRDARATNGIRPSASSTTCAISASDVDSGILFAHSPSPDWMARDSRTRRSDDIPPSLRIITG